MRSFSSKKVFPIIGNWAHNKFIYILWLAGGKSSFLQNIVEEIRPGCRNLIMVNLSLIMVNLSETFLGGIQYIPVWWYVGLKRVCYITGLARPCALPIIVTRSTRLCALLLINTRLRAYALYPSFIRALHACAPYPSLIRALSCAVLLQLKVQCVRSN